MPTCDLDLAPPHRPRASRRRGQVLLATMILLGAGLFCFEGPQAGPNTASTAPSPTVEQQAAPSTETTSSIGAATIPIQPSPPMTSSRHASAMDPEQRHMLIALLFACFTAMATGGYALWRRSFQDMTKSQMTPADSCNRLP